MKCNIWSYCIAFEMSRIESQMDVHFHGHIKGVLVDLKSASMFTRNTFLILEKVH